MRLSLLRICFGTCMLGSALTLGCRHHEHSCPSCGSSSAALSQAAAYGPGTGSQPALAGTTFQATPTANGLTPVPAAQVLSVNHSQRTSASDFPPKPLP